MVVFWPWFAGFLVPMPESRSLKASPPAGFLPPPMPPPVALLAMLPVGDMTDAPPPGVDGPVALVWSDGTLVK